MILVAAIEHLIDDPLHFGVDLNTLLLSVDNGDSLLDVLVDALVDECLYVLASLVEIEPVSCLEGQAQGLLIGFQVVEDLGGKRGCQLSLREARVFEVSLTTNYLVNYLVAR